MSPFSVLLLVFLLVPLLEIYLLIQVGGVIGAGWTVFLVVFTAVVGAYLVRRQGVSTLARVQASLQRNEVPALELVEGAVLLVAGALLLTPGFFTDAIGFACLTPALRQLAIRQLIRRSRVFTAGTAHQRGSEARRTLDGEYRHLDE